MNSAPIETWVPSRAHVRVAWRDLAPVLVFMGPTVLAVLVTILANASALVPLVLFFGGAALLVGVPTLLTVFRSRGLLLEGVRFELTAQAVVVHYRHVVRQSPLTSVARVDVVAVSADRSVGHVVIREQAGDDEAPAIPTGRRVSAGSAGLVTWASVEQVDPAEQLQEGALTFWFVANPDQVADRIRAAVAGHAPHARGPHR